jgi:ubiquinone/menaquinone biosynthesis C-methylase UbiE
MNQELNRDMPSYYAQRATEYDRIYDKPERQADLSELKSILSNPFQGLDVLEIACGTGYWTQYIARTARSIAATDYNMEMLDLAATRNYAPCQMSFRQADAYHLENTDFHGNAGFAGFLWSHVPVDRRLALVRSFHSCLSENARVVWLDGRYVEGSSTPIARLDAAGNSYQERRLTDGSRHEVIKNYPSPDELTQFFQPYAHNLEIRLLQYFWLLSYNVSRAHDATDGG